MKISELFEAELPNKRKIIELTCSMAEGAHKVSLDLSNPEIADAWEQMIKSGEQILSLLKPTIISILGIPSDEGHWTIGRKDFEELDLSTMVDSDDEEALALQKKIADRMSKKRQFKFGFAVETKYVDDVEDKVDEVTEFVKSIYPNAKIEPTFQLRGMKRYFGLYYVITVKMKDLA